MTLSQNLTETLPDAGNHDDARMFLRSGQRTSTAAAMLPSHATTQDIQLRDRACSFKNGTLQSSFDHRLGGCVLGPQSSLPVLQPNFGSSLILLIDRLCSNDHCERVDQNRWQQFDVDRLHRLSCPSLFYWVFVPGRRRPSPIRLKRSANCHSARKTRGLKAKGLS